MKKVNIDRDVRSRRSIAESRPAPSTEPEHEITEPPKDEPKEEPKAPELPEAGDAGAPATPAKPKRGGRPPEGDA